MKTQAPVARILPVLHFHVVFTLPAELRALVRLNRKRLFSLLFQAAEGSRGSFGFKGLNCKKDESVGDKRKTILISAVLIGTLGLFFLYFSVFKIGPGPGVEPSAGIGERAPDFKLPALGGSSVRLSDYRGQVVFLNIWASWCPPCREEMPSMEALSKRLKDRPFKMLAVSIDQGGEEVVGPFVGRLGLTMPVLLDPERKTYKLYGLTGVPETFLIDKNGAVIQRIIGPQTWTSPQWLEYFDRIIG